MLATNAMRGRESHAISAPHAGLRTQFIQDRAIRTIISFAGRDQVAQHFDDRPVRVHAIRHGLFVQLRKRANFSTWALFVAPKFEKLINLLDRKTERARALNEAQLVHVAIVKDPEAAKAALTAPPYRRAIYRLPWLLVGMAGSALATMMMTRFEPALAAHISVAFFIPAIVYLADAVGTQSEAVAVRGLSLSSADRAASPWGAR